MTSTGSGAPANFSTSYDGAGNRAEQFGAPNDLNQYANFVYDGRGNLTDDGTRTYTYDLLDRLTSVTAKSPATNANAKAEFEYDAQDRRTVKRSFTWTGTAWQLVKTTRFVYDGWNLLAELETPIGGTEKLVRSYAWGMGGQAGGLLSVTDFTGATPKTYVPLNDGGGNVVGLADGTGAVVASYRYDTWGNLISATGSAANACMIRWGGGYGDSETGLVYLDHRYYSPTQGRFLTRDPAAEAGGLNLYAYTGNDPVNKVDPLGLQPDDVSMYGDDVIFRGLPPAEQISLTDLQSIPLKREGHDGLSYYLPCSWPGIFRGRNGKFYTQSEVVSSHTVKLDYPIWATALSYLVDCVPFMDDPCPPTLNVTSRSAVYTETYDPNFATAAALWELNAAKGELAESVRDFGDALASVATFIDSFNPVSSSAAVITGETTSGQKLSGSERAELAATQTAGIALKSTAAVLSWLRKARATRMNQVVRVLEARGTIIINKKWAGKIEPISGVLFDRHGFPVFDELYHATMSVEMSLPTVPDTDQFKWATARLKGYLGRNPAARAIFSAEQLEAIDAGRARIPGLIWHHHQDGRTLQLVDGITHEQVRHTGGRATVGGRS